MGFWAAVHAGPLGMGRWLMPPETTESLPEEAQTAARLQFLLVDEDHNDLEYYRALLEKQGYKVCASDSYEVAAHCLEDKPFDFILVGQGTAAFEGRCVLERARSLNQRQPVVVLSRCLDIDCYLEAMQLGAVDYLEKPVSPAEIVRVVRTHLRPTSH
jgi:two-component system phosphoglycerate transport system response regulator PgtA